MIEQIRKRISDEIKKSGKKQIELASEIGVKQQAISEFVNQKSLPALDTLARLCKALDVSADYILGLEDDFGRKTPVKTIKICNVKM